MFKVYKYVVSTIFSALADHFFPQNKPSFDVERIFFIHNLYFKYLKDYVQTFYNLATIPIPKRSKTIKSLFNNYSFIDHYK